MILLELFLSFFKIGLFSFGGGYAMLALIQDEVVTRHHWVTMGEFTDIIAISQITPGPISINSATYIGYKTTNSIWGSVMTTFGVSLPSFLVIAFLIYFIAKCKNSPVLKSILLALRPVVIGMVLTAAVLLMNKENIFDIYSYIILVVSSVLSYYKKLSAFGMFIASSIVGILLYA
ncbi:MAG: chromate transporter [Alphaproteobacteria bacterium]|nr:chromate transporter [Alphaproteobacteria bacterium]